MSSKAKLTGKVLTALIGVMVAILAITASTFAWYFYNVNGHTTKVRMAAGSGTSIQISNSYDGPYSSSVQMDDFNDYLDPVSTDRIANGFQKVTGFEDEGGTIWAKYFSTAQHVDYCIRTLYLKANASDDVAVYLSDITGINRDENNPLSSAIRVGFVIYEPGQSENVKNEYIFAIDDVTNPQGQFNTYTDLDYRNNPNIVLDSTKNDGSTVYFKPYDEDNYVNYDADQAMVYLNPQSTSICTLQGDGTPVRVDVYFWLEGCDPDCYGNLAGQSLDKMALSFAGYIQ